MKEKPSFRSDNADDRRMPLRRLILLCIVICVAPPVVIDILYSFGLTAPIIKTPFSAGDMLGYSGAMSTAFIALFGLIYGVADGWRQQRTQNRESAAPYFSMTVLTQRNKKTPFDLLAPLSEEGPTEASHSGNGVKAKQDYCEVELREIYAIIGDDISYKSRLDEEQQERSQSTFKSFERDGITYTAVNPTIYIPVRFRNTGQGCANGVKVGINRRNEEFRGVDIYSLDHGEGFYFGIFLDLESVSIPDEYEVRISFYDCLGYRYIETFELQIGMDDSERTNAMLEFVGRKTMTD